MPTETCNDIEICYETFGSPDDPAILLVMGLGAQMIFWPDEFCNRLADRGFHVVRFDNRDIGLSQKFDEAGMPDIVAAFSGEAKPAYTLDDMADDAAALLDALGIEKAHVVGASMGGMIAQLVTIRHPEKVLSLTSIMSHAGGEHAEPPTPEAMQALLSPRPKDRDEVIKLAVEVRKVIGSTGFDVDEEHIAEMAGRAYDRCHYPEGMARQLVAIMAAPSRFEDLQKVEVPTLVIHGEDDPLVPAKGGHYVAEAVPGAELELIEGMGHDLPEGAWPRIIDRVVENTRKAAAATS